MQLDNNKENLENIINETTETLTENDHDQIMFTKLKYTDEKIQYTMALLPVWICAYKYKNKIYRFLVNGTTGEVVGDRPYSKLKMTIAWIYSILLIFSLFFSFAAEYYIMAAITLAIGLLVSYFMLKK